MQSFCPFNSAQEMADYVTKTNNRLHHLANEIDFHYSATKNINDTIKKAIKGRRGLIRECQRSKAVEKHMEELTTFETGRFISFLSQVLSIIENEPYESVRILGNERRMITNSYYVIAPTNVIKILNTSKEITDVASIKKNSLPGRYIILPEITKTTLLKGIELDPIFASFPFLKDLAYDVIDMRNNNPRVSDISAMIRIEFRLYQNYNQEKVNER